MHCPSLRGELHEIPIKAFMGDHVRIKKPSREPQAVL